MDVDVDVEVGRNMATGRIRRSARRGIAAAVLGWLAVAAFSLLLAPSASAAPTATVEIRNVTPPAVSVDKGGSVTFVNAIPAENRGGVSIPLVGTFSATVYTDVAVNFFGQNRPLQPGQRTAWTFDDPATTGTIAYTYRIVPQAGLSVTVANQVINTVAGQLPALPAPVPYVVQTILPNLPQLPSVNLPQLPQIDVTLPGGGGGGTPPTLPPTEVPGENPFDPTRFFLPGSSLGGADRSGSGGSGGLPGSYDGASVPVFGQLTGLDGSGLDDQSAAQSTAADGGPDAQTLPAAALAAVVALAAVTAALVRTHQA